MKRALHIAAALLGSTLLFQVLPLQVRATPASSPDAWSSLVTFRTQDGWYAAPVHATLMPNGNILFFGIAGQTQDFTQATVPVRPSAFVYTPPPYWQALPSSVTINETPEPVDYTNSAAGNYIINDSLICGGDSLTADGKFFSAGGTRDLYDPTTLKLVGINGFGYSTIYDGTSWTRVPSGMVGTAPNGQTGRWYPTVTRLPDGRMLVTSGFQSLMPAPNFNLSVEAFDPTAGTYSLISSYQHTPLEILNDDYTHIGVLPTRPNNNDLLMFGSPGVPVLLNLSSNPVTWTVSANVRPGSETWNQTRVANGGAYDPHSAPDYGASSMMLPIRVADGDLGYSNGTMLIASGAMNTPFITHVDRYDPRTDSWLPDIDTGVQRHHPMTLNMPDGRVLIIGGHSTDPNITHAEYLDPQNNFLFSLGTADGVEIRGYHATSLLLPDGRVMVVGGRDAVTDTSAEKPNFRMYYPWYMFASGRPAITSVPQSLSIGAQFQVGVSTSRPVTAELISLGSMTHSFDEDQRAIQVAVSNVTGGASGTWQATLTAPASAQIAPPGYYMLFVQDGRRVPSIARIVHLG